MKWAKENHGKSAVPKWNFHKLLINKMGKIEETYSSLTKPNSKKIISRIDFFEQLAFQLTLDGEK